MVSLYLSCLPPSQHEVVLERLRYAMPNNTELGLRYTHTHTHTTHYTHTPPFMHPQQVMTLLLSVNQQPTGSWMVSESPSPSSGRVLSQVVAAQVAASRVARRKHGAAQVPGPDVEQQLSEVSDLLEHVSVKKTR